MRVRPEVSELSAAGSMEFNGFEIPALSIRRSETTVELGSGQSMVIAGLMRNTFNNSVQRTPFLGSLPVIGALFRSNNFRRNETELVIIVTPYLVQPGLGKPDRASDRRLPQYQRGQSAADRSASTTAAVGSSARCRRPTSRGRLTPGLSAVGAPAPALPGPAPARQAQRQDAILQRGNSSSPQPGFNF